MSLEVGHVISDRPPSQTECLIKLNRNTSVRPLQYLVTEWTDNNGERKYGALLRVRRILYLDRFSTAAALDLEHTTGLPVVPQKDRAYLPGTFMTAETEILDNFIEENGKIITIGQNYPPKPGAPVKTADKRLANIIIGDSPEKYTVFLGHLVGSEDLKMTLNANHLVRHMLIVGGTGTGKSWFRGVLMEELTRKGVIQINFDFLGDYSRAVEELGGVNLTLGKDLRPRLDLLTSGEFESMIRSHIPTDFQRTIAVGGFEKFKTTSRSALQPIEPSRLPEFVEEASYEYEAREDTRRNTVERIRTFLRSYDIFGSGSNWKGILSHHSLINIEFASVDESTIRIGIGAVLKELWHLRSKGEIPPFVVSFEEAHMILPRERNVDNIAALVVKRLLRYGRHHGIGVIMITQRPSSIDPEAVGMPATRVIFALDPYEAATITKLLTDMDESVKALLPRLERGTAIITATRDILKHSLYIRVRSDRKTTHGGHEPELICR